MTSGSNIEKVSLPRLVGGFHSVRSYSGVLQASSYCSPGPPHQWRERRPDRFLERLLNEVFSWRLLALIKHQFHALTCRVNV
jgi:hypothetical protein